MVALQLNVLHDDFSTERRQNEEKVLIYINIYIASERVLLVLGFAVRDEFFATVPFGVTVF